MATQRSKRWTSSIPKCHKRIRINEMRGSSGRFADHSRQCTAKYSANDKTIPTRSYVFLANILGRELLSPAIYPWQISVLDVQKCPMVDEVKSSKFESLPSCRGLTRPVIAVSVGRRPRCRS